MNAKLNMSLGKGYKNKSQKIRVVTEKWIEDHGYCPFCGNSKLKVFENNKPVVDFYCERCKNQYELKSKSGKVGKKINDGAYETMIKRITSNENPNLLVLTYNKIDYRVNDLLVIPKFFFAPQIIERRKPLAQTARRSGWVGCNILFSEIPKQAQVYIIKNSLCVRKENVLKKMNTNNRLRVDKASLRGLAIRYFKLYRKN